MARSGAKLRERREGIVIHRLRPLLAVGNAALLPGLTWSLRRFDLIHLHYPFFGGEFTTLASIAWRTPLVITYQHDVLLGGVMGVIERIMRQTVVRATLRRAAKVLFSSLDYAAASHIRPLLAGRADRIGELPNGVDVTIFSPGDVGADFNARYRPNGDEQIVLLVAGLDRAHYFKGVGVLLEALVELPSKIRLIVVGDGDLRASYEAEALSRGISARVHFAGRVPDGELPEYYRLADVTVLPSVTMGEAFGLVLVESLACATPVIATDLPGVRTVVDQGRAGLLVPPGDAQALAAAIGRILGDDNTRAQWGREGTRQVQQRYTWEKIGDRLEVIYRGVLRE
jgi:glycosyltransferase involved in cell wall biosynthesis